MRAARWVAPCPPRRKPRAGEEGDQPREIRLGHRYHPLLRRQPPEGSRLFRPPSQEGAHSQALVEEPGRFEEARQGPALVDWARLVPTKRRAYPPGARPAPARKRSLSPTVSEGSSGSR